MKQLTKHIMAVRFFKSGQSNPAFSEKVDCADAVASRQLGRQIAEWMARAPGYRVESETLQIERK